MTLDDVAAKLKSPKPKQIRGGRGFTAHCPAHKDDNPSFAVWEGADEWLHFNCQGKCTEDAILSALGMTQEDRRVGTFNPQRANSDIVFTYTDEHGAYLFEKVRLKGDKKNTRQRIRHGTGYIYNLVNLNGKSKTFYRLAEVLTAVKAGKTIYINEGEPAVEAFRTRGLVATCQPAGAGSGKWLEQHTALLKGATVVIVADRDEVGEAYAKEVYSALDGVAVSVTVVQSKTEGKGHDARDHFDAGHKVDQFITASHLMQLDIPGMVTFAAQEFSAYTVEYLWEPYFHFGQSCLFVADSGVGKSTLMIAMAAAFSQGQLPCGDGKCEPVKTAYFIGDSDPADAYETLYRANGGVPGMTAWIKDARPLNAAFKADVKKLAKMGFRFIVVDPLYNYMAMTKNDSNDGLQAADAFGVLADAAEENKVCIVVAHHVGKGASQKSASEVHLGSVMLKARARGYLYARKHPEERGLIVVTDEKGSLLVPKGEAFAYRRVGQEVQYLESFENPFDEEQRSKGGNCRDWILGTLTSSWMLGKALAAKAANAGFSERTFERTRAALIKENLVLKGGVSENIVYCLASQETPYDPWGDTL